MDKLYPIQSLKDASYGSGVPLPLNLIASNNLGPLVPPAVDFLIPKVQVQAGNAHSLALDNNGNVWSWGFNRFGECGDGTHDVTVTPHVPGTQHLTAIKVQTLLNNSSNNDTQQSYFVINAANWDHTSLTLTQTGAFANYQFVPGDKIHITAQTSTGHYVVAGTYDIATKVDNNSITLGTDITAPPGYDVSDNTIPVFLNNSTGVASNDPAAVPLGNIVGISAGWGLLAGPRQPGRHVGLGP